MTGMSEVPTTTKAQKHTSLAAKFLKVLRGTKMITANLVIKKEV